MKKACKTLSVLSALIVSLGLFSFSGSALPATFVNEGLEDAVGGTDTKKMFEGTQMWIGNEADLKDMASAGKIGISSKKNAKTKNYVIEGNRSIYAINYQNSNNKGAPMKEWCNMWMTHDTNFGLNNSSTYVISFVLRTYTPWQPEPLGGVAMQNFGVVSIRNYRYKGGDSLVDYFIQPNITGDDVTADQMIRVDDKTTPPNSKNTMSIKKLDSNTFSVVCKFVTGVPTTDVENGNNHWFASFTFHGPGIIACDNIKVYKSDLALSSFHQKVSSSSGTSTKKPTTVDATTKANNNTTLSGSIDKTTASGVTDNTTDVADGSSVETTVGIQETTAAEETIQNETTTSSQNANTTPTKKLNVGATIALIVGALVVIAGGGVACYFLIIKKKKA